VVHHHTKPRTRPIRFTRLTEMPSVRLPTRVRYVAAVLTVWTTDVVPGTRRVPVDDATTERATP